VFAGEVTSRMLATYEAAGLLTLCGWCKRVKIDSEWHLTPLMALAAIDDSYSITHSICPACDVAPSPVVSLSL
jgi:hypothetical protein